VTELSGYELEPIREGADFTLYRGRQSGGPLTGDDYISDALRADLLERRGRKSLCLQILVDEYILIYRI
jgi:hypothetical protein